MKTNRTFSDAVPVFGENWILLKGIARQFFPKLSDDDLDDTNGEVEKLSKFLQKKMAISPTVAMSKIHLFVAANGAFIDGVENA